MEFWKIILGSLVIASNTSAAASGPATFDEKQINQMLKEAVDGRRTVGIVLGTIDADGSRIFSYGKTSKHGVGVDGDTVFEIGSATKTFTAILLADMAAREQLSLYDPISKYLPESVKVPSRGEKEITLLHLATHHSGLPRLPSNLVPADAENPYADYSVDKMYAFLSSYTLTRDIGEKYEYSNYGFGLLGHVLSLKAGKSYEALLQERNFAPLGMTSSAVTLTPEMKSRLAMGHTTNLTRAKNWDLGALAGAGAIRSSVKDMLIFVAANLSLKPSSLFPAMNRTHEVVSDTTIPDTYIGLAWHITKKYGSEIVWHNGGTGGYHSFIGFDQANRFGVVILSNSTNSIDDIGMHILNSQFVLSKFEAPKERKEIKLDSKLFDAYVGAYQIIPTFIITISKDNDALYLQATGQGKVRLHPEAETEFFIGEVDAQISFVKGADGPVTHLILHQNGRDQKAVKIK